jgi:hypothetical protein
VGGLAQRNPPSSLAAGYAVGITVEIAEWH